MTNCHITIMLQLNPSSFTNPLFSTYLIATEHTIKCVSSNIKFISFSGSILFKNMKPIFFAFKFRTCNVSNGPILHPYFLAKLFIIYSSGMFSNAPHWFYFNIFIEHHHNSNEQAKVTNETKKFYRRNFLFIIWNWRNKIKRFHFIKNLMNKLDFYYHLSYRILWNKYPNWTSLKTYLPDGRVNVLTGFFLFWCYR